MVEDVTASGETGFGLQCPKCRVTFVIPSAASFSEQDCSLCGTSSKFHLFPRYFREPEVIVKPSLSHKGDATCVFYPDLKAEMICDECGSFLSSKAAVDWVGSTYCMPCLHHLREKKKETDFQAKTQLHDNRALALSLFLLPVSLFTAPLAVFVLLKNRKSPGGFVPRGKFRWWLAMILSSGLTLGWLTMIVIWISLIVREFS